MTVEPRRLILSRKGFDSASGGGPSPIIEGIPMSLPIPGEAFEGAPTYRELNLGEFVLAASKGKVSPDDPAHLDPFFSPTGQCAFGQADAAQSHLANQGVEPGDCFLFFGLFANPKGHERHHRIFGYLLVDQILDPSSSPPPEFASRHPHFHGELRHRSRNAVYVGAGCKAQSTEPMLRLSAIRGEKPSLWQVPDWLHSRKRLTYHNAPGRWLHGNLLQSVGRGQEFVVEIAGNRAAQVWLRAVIAHIEMRK